LASRPEGAKILHSADFGKSQVPDVRHGCLGLASKFGQNFPGLNSKNLADWISVNVTLEADHFLRLKAAQLFYESFDGGARCWQPCRRSSVIHAQSE